MIEIITKAKEIASVGWTNRSIAAPTIPANKALKNLTALELDRFIDKRLTDTKKSWLKESNPERDSTFNALELADDHKGRQLRQKLNQSQIGRKEVITNTVNLGIENPFANYSLTL